MKKIIHLIVVALSIFCTSCVFDEIIDENTEQTVPEYPTEKPEVMLTDTMTITVIHTSDTLPSFRLKGYNSMITGQSTSNGMTVVNTVGTDGVTLSGIMDIDSISIVVVNK